MAAKKPAKKAKRSTSTRRSKAKAPKLSPEMRQDIAAVFLALLAVLISFACFNFGGTAVTNMFHVLRIVMGYSAYLLPVICGALAWMLFRPSHYAVRGLNYFGFLGLLASMSALFHIGIAPADAQLAAQNGCGRVSLYSS